jgi:hypothetical protein
MGLQNKINASLKAYERSIQMPQLFKVFDDSSNWFGWQ